MGTRFLASCPSMGLFTSLSNKIYLFIFGTKKLVVENVPDAGGWRLSSRAECRRIDFITARRGSFIFLQEFAKNRSVSTTCALAQQHSFGKKGFHSFSSFLANHARLQRGSGWRACLILAIKKRGTRIKREFWAEALLSASDKAGCCSASDAGGCSRASVIKAMKRVSQQSGP